MEVTDLKFKKSKMLLGTMCALVLATTIGAFPSKAESAFDYNYYFWKYPDVANAVGFDPQALFNHYQTSGMAEGRYANQQADLDDLQLNYLQSLRQKYVHLQLQSERQYLR